MKRKLKYLTVNGEPVYVVINDEVLGKCAEGLYDAYVELNYPENIIYLPTKKHIQKFLIKHEYHHLLNRKKLYDEILHRFLPAKHHKIKWFSNNEIYDIEDYEVKAFVYCGSIYEKSGIFYFREYIANKMKKLRNYVKEEYLKLKKKENDLH